MKKAVITEYHVTTEYSVPQPLKIAEVSDLHERRADDVLALLKETKPDVIFVVGDTFERYDNRPQYDFERKPIKKLIINAVHYLNFVLKRFQRGKNKPKTQNAYDFLQEAVKIAPVYFSLGNHEQMLLEKDVRFLANAGVNLLDNETREIEIKGCRILLGGMSMWENEEFLEDYLARKGLKILLCHNPRYYVELLTDSDITLTLSGHTHGGQVRIGKKGRGFFVPGQGIFGRYAHGSFFDGRLIVSSGCSNTVVCPRLFNPCELVVVHLKGKEHGTV